MSIQNNTLPDNPNIEVIKAKQTGLFTNYIFKAIPLAFDESMSYYETLCGLLNYLKNTILPTLNNNADAVAELQTLYIELKTYVDNAINEYEELIDNKVQSLEDYMNDYFNNLDVQEEINNKLNDMVEQGTLQEIIADYLNSKAIFGFDNVQSMKESTNLINGSYAQTLGFYTKNDGGNALYKIRERNIDDIIDEMFIIEINQTLIAELIYNNEINTKQCGLKGDGTTNETNKLNTFLNKSINANKIINKGTYLIDGTLFVQGQWKQSNNSHYKIIFDKSNILYQGYENNCSLMFYNLYHNEIIGLSINQNSVDNYIDFVGCTNSIFKNFEIKGLGIRKDNSILPPSAYQSQAVELMTFEDGNITDTITINPVDSYTNQINFNKVNINPRNKNYCVNLLGANAKHNINFNQCDLSYPDIAIFNVETTNTGHGNITCINCYFDSAKPLFSNNNQNGLRFNNISNKFSAGSINQVESTKLEDIMNNVSIGNDIFSGNKLPLIMRNYAKNGDISSNVQDTSTNRLLGTTSSKSTKEMITSNSGLYGYAQKITYSDNEILYADGLTTAPFKGHYNFAIRMKVISGSCTKIQLGFGGEYMDYAFDKLPVGDEILIVNNKYINKNIGDTIRGSLEVVGNNNLIIEIYEVMILYGNLTLCGLPLISVPSI